METYTFQSLGDDEYIINTKVDGKIVSFYTIDDGFGCTIDIINDDFIVVHMRDEETGEITSIPLPSEESTEVNNNLLLQALEVHIEDEKCY